MMPNVLQYPVALAGVLRAGCVVVNVNPLYTPRELEHQLKDSGAEAIVDPRELRRHAAAGDREDADQARGRRLASATCSASRRARSSISRCARSRRWCRRTRCPGHVALQRRARRGRAAASSQPVDVGPEDVAFLQYTGGTTGVVQGRDADAPQPGRQRAADRSLAAAGARRHEPRPGAGAVDLRLRAAALSRLRATRELPVRHAARRAERADRESARHPGLRQGARASTSSTCSRRVNTLLQRAGRESRFRASSTSPSLRDLERRRHGGAAGGRREVARSSPACRSSRATACRRPRRSRPATRSWPASTTARSACRSRAPRSRSSTTTGQPRAARPARRDRASAARR